MSWTVFKEVRNDRDEVVDFRPALHHVQCHGDDSMLDVDFHVRGPNEYPFFFRRLLHIQANFYRRIVAPYDYYEEKDEFRP